MTKVECQDLFQVAKCGCNSTNSFMRTVYCGKLWLTRAEAENAVYNGWNMADTFILRLEMGILVHVFWKTEQQSMGYLSIRSYPSCLLRKHLALVVPSVHRMAGHCTMSVRRYTCFAICCHLAVVWVWVLCNMQSTFNFPPCVRLLRLQMVYVLEQPSAEYVLNPASQALSVPGLMCVMCMSTVWGMHVGNAVF
jgi:hypothetical protein